MSAPFEIDNTVRPTVRMPRVDGRPMDDRAVVSGPVLRGPVEDAAPTRPAFDAQRLWTGGLATAVVAALIGLVGTLVLRAIMQFAPAAHLTAFGTSQTALLCALAAAGALAATGVAHLLLVSTPRPLAYLGWIVGLVTAAATVVPLIGSTPITVGLAQGALHLVIGLAIGTLVGGAAASATRLGARAGLARESW